MQISKHDATDERRILVGMVVDDTVCGRVSDRWTETGLFRVRWTNLVGGWCVSYYRKYGVAPRGDVEGLFTSWAARANDDDTVALVDDFLSDLSGAYEEEGGDINPEYLVDTAAAYFNEVSLERLAETITAHIRTGRVDEALAASAKWNKLEMGAGAAIDVLHDTTAIREAFESRTEPLITYPGDLGRFFGDQLARDEFVGITGATGRGKTWWLMDIAWQGIRQGRRVAFFEVGDMSQNQIMRRFMCRAAGRPLRPPYNLEIPSAITRDRGSSVADVEYVTKRFDGPLTHKAAVEACGRKTRRRKKTLLRLSVHPNSSVDVSGIDTTLDTWERDGWVPDVVVIDYADILAPPPGYVPGDREAINSTWKNLRSLSQRRHCLVVTATQADANSYTANTISRSNFSDDRRKNDHVTAMLGLNATSEEQEAGVYRLNWTKRREDAYTEARCVYVAGSLALGRPHIVSTF